MSKSGRGATGSSWIEANQENFAESDQDGASGLNPAALGRRAQQELQRFVDALRGLETAEGRSALRWTAEGGGGGGRFVDALRDLGTAEGRPSYRWAVVAGAAVCMVAAVGLILFGTAGRQQRADNRTATRAAGGDDVYSDRALELPPLEPGAADLTVTAGGGTGWRGSEDPVVADNAGGVAQDGNLEEQMADLLARPAPAPVAALADLAPTAGGPPPAAAVPAPSTAGGPGAGCSAAGVNCLESRCCTAAGERCYEKNSTHAFCKPECRLGPDMTEQEYHLWTCRGLGPRTPGKGANFNWAGMLVPDWVKSECSPMGSNCLETRCCSDPGMQCYSKDDTFASCKPDCVSGPDFEDSDDATHWTCKEVGPRTPGTVRVDRALTQPLPEWAKTSCAGSGEACSDKRCCHEPGMQCFEKDASWSTCKPECVPGPQPEDRADQPWTCKALGPRTPGVAETPMIRRGSFLVVGDWGWDPAASGIAQDCQLNIAGAMDTKATELGDVKFVINLGDSLSSEGVGSSDDPQWDTKWRRVYSPQLRKVPWYSVYGDRDYRKDPCACTMQDEECAQVNFDKDNLDRFQMPGTSYYQEYPELGIELVGLDLNDFQNGADPGATGVEKANAFQDCFKTTCAFMCAGTMKNRTQRSLSLFNERMRRSSQKSLVVFSHYPTDYLTSAPDFLETLKDDSRYGITYFGAHRQTTDQSGASIAPNANWVVGGGGGDACASENQGFVVGEIWADSSITASPVYVSPGPCCGGHRSPA